MAGVLRTLLVALDFEQTTVWPPTGRPISADLIDDLLENADVDIVFVAPSTLEQLGQSQVSLERSQGELLDGLFPYVSKANERAPAYAKLDIDHIFFTKTGKTMLRTDNGTVKRRPANQAYEEEIVQLYKGHAGFGDPSDAVQLNPRGQAALRSGIRSMLTETEGLQDITFEEGFWQGL